MESDVDEEPTNPKAMRYVVRTAFTGIVIATYEITGNMEMIEERVERHRKAGHIVTIEPSH